MLKDQAVWALGCMSGTSLDGIDAALVRTNGAEISEFGATKFMPYTQVQHDQLRAVLGCWPEADGVSEAAELVETTHAVLLSSFLLEDVDMIGFHGQTLAHDPRNRGTHQCGSGQILAEVLQTPVVWDFRTADVELGGEGAPLAPFFHHACARYIGETDPVVFLNLGGVGNVTWVDPSVAQPQTDGACLAFDTGPANAPINDLMQNRLGATLDKDGALAAQGTVDAQVVTAFLNHAYFFRMPPKSLDRDDFSDLSTMVSQLSDADAVRTLTACAAAAVAAGMTHFPKPPTRVLVTGGGRLNPVLMEELSARISVPVVDIDETGLNGDMLEAQAFAYLAVRVARGLPTSCPTTTGVAAAVGGGVMSKPEKRG